jgi:hypothetical protein
MLQLSPQFPGARVHAPTCLLGDSHVQGCADRPRNQDY